MEQKEIISSIEAILKELLKRDNVVLVPETKASDVDGWDSLINMMLVSRVEKHFGIRFNFREIARFSNVGDMSSSVMSKLR